MHDNSQLSPQHFTFRVFPKTVFKRVPPQIRSFRIGANFSGYNDLFVSISKNYGVKVMIFLSTFAPYNTLFLRINFQSSNDSFWYHTCALFVHAISRQAVGAA
jgi:hypothetical protein